MFYALKFADGNIATCKCESGWLTALAQEGEPLWFPTREKAEDGKALAEEECREVNRLDLLPIQITEVEE